MLKIQINIEVNTTILHRFRSKQKYMHTDKVIHKNFWTTVPGKTQCGKTGATDGGLYLCSTMKRYFTEFSGEKNKLAYT